jgi:myotubularin-related protein 1/2
MTESNPNDLMRQESKGLAQGTNVLGNLFSLSDMISGQSVEDLEKIHQNQKKLKDEFVANKEEMRKKLGLLDCESIVFKGDATFRKENDFNNFGLIILTEFRFIFQFLEKNSEKEKFKDDFFKIPFLLFEKLTKGEQKSTYLPFTIKVRDGRKLKFFINEKNKDIFEELNSRAFPKKFDLFEFPKILNDNLNKNPQFKALNGWNIYDFNKEFLRQGVIFDDPNCHFRICQINKDFKNIPTYPQLLVEPKNLSDDIILKASKHRTKGRVPTLSYYFDNKINGVNSDKISGIWRSSQFKAGLLGSKSNEDIQLIKEIKSLGNNFVIYDARPYINAASNKVKGGGFEDVEQYGNDAKLIFCNIENIHKAREAIEKTEEICTDEKIMTNKAFWSQFESTGWLDFIMITLKITNEIAKLVSEGNNVLIHCSDGWDRTPQLVTISQILLDPYYRTFMGFAVLIEKDWLGFGHQFAKRSGMIEKKNEGENERSPIFLQFLDCIYQLIIQFPSEFEFNAEYLLYIAKIYNVNMFGTFMFNNEEERFKNKAKETTPSVWTYLLNNKEKYINPLYSSKNCKKIITPNYAYYSYRLWTSYFMRNSEYAE